MAEELDSTSMTLVQRVVLLGVTHLSHRGDTPVHSADVRRACANCFDEVDADVLGRLSEPDVIRTLNRLEADGLVEAVSVENTSPVGKGRPTYALSVEVDAVLDAFEDDERVVRVVDHIRAQRA
ncbi:hypothetical protein ACFQPA_11140 [Halomarina halobia]|uniref:MarR family transcriptional regulator n=1 Tax=Halomarina halobia TaxID=3033386 RepID=A0ABD6AAZ0_9EURY|nr:hypothetical protein [Halomarina sp. PSR21]